VSSAYSVIRSFLALGSAEAVSRIIAFGVALYLARTLGPEGYGVIALAIGVNLYLGKIADFGIEAVGIKEIADAPRDSKRIASAVMSARLAITLVMVTVSGVVSALFLPSPENAILPLYFLSLIPIAGSTRWVHMGLGEIRIVGIARVVSEVLIMALMIWLVHGIQNLWYVPLGALAGESVFAILLFGYLVVKGHGFGWRWDWRTARPVFAKGLPMFVQLTLGLLLYNADLVFLRAMRGHEEVGHYAAAYALISFVANLGMAYATTLLSTISRVRKNPIEESTLYRAALGQVYALSIAVTVGGCLLAPEIINVGYGKGYSGSIAALQILVWAIPFFLVRYVPWVALIARGRGHLVTRPMVWGVVVNLLLNALLVPRLGVVGAALATVAAEVCCCVGKLIIARREGLPFLPFRSFWRPTVAVVVMGLSLMLIGPLGPILQVMLGAAVFAGVMTGLTFLTAKAHA
jgi:O-antigen/teichoic acid export membrane protein